MQNHELVESVGTYDLKVIRCSGARGRVIVPFWTEDGTAKQGKEYEKQEGQLIFENNESEWVLFRVFFKKIILSIIENFIQNQLSLPRNECVLHKNKTAIKTEWGK